MLKRLSFFIILISSHLFGELAVWMQGGGNLNLVVTNGQTSASLELGGTFRTALEIKPINKIAIQPEIEYALYRWNSRQVIFNQYHLHLLSTPILVKFIFKKKLYSLHFFIGPKFTWNITSHTRLNGSQEFTLDNPKQFKDFSIGGTMGLNLILEFSKTYSFVFDWRYQMDFTSTSIRSLDVFIANFSYTIGIKRSFGPAL